MPWVNKFFMISQVKSLTLILAKTFFPKYSSLKLIFLKKFPLEFVAVYFIWKDDIFSKFSLWGIFLKAKLYFWWIILSKFCKNFTKFQDRHVNIFFFKNYDEYCKNPQWFFYLRLIIKHKKIWFHGHNSFLWISSWKRAIFWHYFHDFFNLFSHFSTNY